MHNFVSKFLIPFTLVSVIGIFPLAGFCQACSNEGEPCGDGFGNPCCPSWNDANGECKKLKCSTDPGSENTCVDDGACE